MEKSSGEFRGKVTRCPPGSRARRLAKGRKDNGGGGKEAVKRARWD